MILRKPEVAKQFGYKSLTSVGTRVRSGLFTKPVAIGERAVGWPLTEVEALAKATIAGASEAQIKALVCKLHREREALLADITA